LKHISEGLFLRFEEESPCWKTEAVWGIVCGNYLDRTEGKVFIIHTDVMIWRDWFAGRSSFVQENAMQ